MRIINLYDRREELRMRRARWVLVYAVGQSVFAQRADGKHVRLAELKDGTTIRSINSAIWEGVEFEDSTGVIRHIDQHGVMRVLSPTLRDWPSHDDFMRLVKH